MGKLNSHVSFAHCVTGDEEACLPIDDVVRSDSREELMLAAFRLMELLLSPNSSQLKKRLTYATELGIFHYLKRVVMHPEVHVSVQTAAERVLYCCASCPGVLQGAKPDLLVSGWLLRRLKEQVWVVHHKLSGSLLWPVSFLPTNLPWNMRHITVIAAEQKDVENKRVMKDLPTYLPHASRHQPLTTTTGGNH